MKYIVGMNLDKKTGELTQVSKNIIPKLDETLIRKEEKYDGYYSIVTSELDLPDDEIIDALSRSNASHLNMNCYKALYYSDVLKWTDLHIGTNLKQKHLKLEDIKNIVSEIK